MELIYLKGEIKMNENNQKLLEQVSENRLQRALDLGTNSEESKAAFDEAMRAADRLIEVTKLEEAKQEKAREEELKKAESKRMLWIRIAEFGGTLLLAPAVDYFCKRGFAKLCMVFEEKGTFTSLAGKSLSGLFRFKK